MQFSLSKRGAFFGAATFLLATTLSAATYSATPTGEGTYLQWTPKSGTVHYTQIDEATCNGNTDRVHTTVVGQRDSYTMTLTSVPSGSLITGVSITPCASRNTSGAGSSTLNVFYRLNGANSADAGAYALPTGTTPAALSATAFLGLSVDKTASTTLEVGAVYSSGDRGVRLSRLSGSVTYSTLDAPTNATSSVVGTSTVTVSWSDALSFEDSFAVSRSTDDVSYSHLATTSANATSYDNSGLSSGTYYYKVRAYNAGFYSGYSSTTIATVP